MFKKDTLQLIKITGTQKWKVAKSFDFILDGQMVTVPKGFETDLASTPRITWVVFPKSGTYTEAAVIHDCLYKSGQYKRKSCDKVFKKALRYCGVGFIRANAMYRAVRMFGGSSFKG